MRVLKTNKGIASFLELLRKRAAGVNPQIEKTVRGILADVKKRGEVAVEKYTRMYDKHDLPLMLAPAEIKKHANRADRKIVKALELSAERIR